MKSVLKQAEAIVITMLLVLRRHSVVWTGHNLEPHDGWNGPIERALFWAMRLVIQLFFFDAKPYLRNTFLKIGFHGLTLVFVWQTAVYGWVAIGG